MLTRIREAELFEILESWLFAHPYMFYLRFTHTVRNFPVILLPDFLSLHSRLWMHSAMHSHIQYTKRTKFIGPRSRAFLFFVEKYFRSFYCAVPALMVIKPISNFQNWVSVIISCALVRSCVHLIDKCKGT